MIQRDQELIREFFRIHPDYSLCKSLVQNVRAGVCGLDHAEQTLYLSASSFAQNREAIDDKLDSRKTQVGGRWRLLKSLSEEEIGCLEDDAFLQAAQFYLKNPYAHGRVIRPKWYRPGFTRNHFLRRLLAEAIRRGMQDLAQDLRSLILLA